MKFLSCVAALLLTALAAWAEDPATFPVGAFTFSRPADWSWVPVTSTMRAAQLRVAGTDGAAPADVTFFYFGQNSGTVQSNVERWTRQFQAKPDAEKTETIEVGTTKVTIVSTEGTFASGMPGGPTTPMADYALLGAILEHPNGAVFVKMTGPSALVKGKRPQFVDFITAAAKTLK